MPEERELNLGPQPLQAILEKHDLKAHDLVMASKVPMTHKMVSRAVKGRRLTGHTKSIVLDALNAASGGHYSGKDCFTY